jgi:hypothetical protein
MSHIFETIVAWLTSSGIGIPMIVSFAVALFLKYCPREKVAAILKPIAISIGFAINTVLLKIFPRKTAIKVEEGIVCTITYAGRMFFTWIEEEVLKDNAIELKTGEAKILKHKSLVIPIVNKPSVDRTPY